MSSLYCKGGNRNSIGIEHVALPGEKFTPDQEKSSILLLKWLLSEYKLSASNITGHRFAADYSGGPTGTDCPHSLFGDRSKQAITDWINKNIV